MMRRNRSATLWTCQNEVNCGHSMRRVNVIALLRKEVAEEVQEDKADQSSGQ
jgi:hypothetical protein